MIDYTSKTLDELTNLYRQTYFNYRLMFINPVMYDIYKIKDFEKLFEELTKGIQMKHSYGSDMPDEIINSITESVNNQFKNLLKNNFIKEQKEVVPKLTILKNDFTHGLDNKFESNYTLFRNIMQRINNYSEDDRKKIKRQLEETEKKYYMIFGSLSDTPGDHIRQIKTSVDEKFKPENPLVTQTPKSDIELAGIQQYRLLNNYVSNLINSNR